MADNAVAADQDSLRDLLEEQGIRRVAIVDDAFDPIDVWGLTLEERDLLWAAIEFDADVQDEFTRLQLEIDSANDLTDGLIAKLLENPSQCPAFKARWDKSDAALRMNAGLREVKLLASHLRETLDLEVEEFESTVEPELLIHFNPQLLFLDWHLGDDASSTVVEAISGPDLPVYVKASTEKALNVWQKWPDEKPRPLIVLMSSKPSMPQDAGDFCRRSKVLRGMFHAVSKSALGAPFSLHMHMRLFAMSLPEGRRIQTFMDALRRKFQVVRDQFLDDISDLSLNDYSYIQSLTLKNDDQPLGDYLQQLFSSYLGQLLFAEALGEDWADLDTMTFGEALPSLEPPSDRLTKVYHTALFDTNVGPIRSHPLAAQTSDSAANYLPVLALGDILKRESTNGDASNEIEAPELEQPLEEGTGIHSGPDLFLLINAQCDLEIRPNSSNRSSIDERSILLLPGHLKPLLEANGDNAELKTELYEHEEERYRIEWNTKKVLAIPLDQFNDWKVHEKYERVARLRLPYALEIQRAFAANLTRVGTPVTPPIYQPATARLLRRHETEKTYVAADSLEDDETAFLVLARDGQNCVLTLPLLVRLKELLYEELDALQTQKASQEGNLGHLQARIDALERAIDKETEWAKLRSPFELPKKFFNGRIQIAQGVNEGDGCDNSVVVAVSLD